MVDVEAVVDQIGGVRRIVTVDGRLPFRPFPCRGLSLYRGGPVPSYIPRGPFVPSFPLVPLFPKRLKEDDKVPVTREL